jgi:hypothetical protein
MSKNEEKYSEIWTNDGPDDRLVRKAIEPAVQTTSVLKEADQILAEKQITEDFPELMEAFGPRRVEELKVGNHKLPEIKGSNPVSWLARKIRKMIIDNELGKASQLPTKPTELHK